MNDLTEFTGPSEAIGRRYGAQGPGGGLVRTVATDLFPIVPSSDDLMDPELHYLAGSILAAGTIADAAVAANFSGVGLQNPAGSGVIVVVQRIRVLNSDTVTTDPPTEFNLTVDPTGLSAGPDATERGWPLDMRYRGRRTSAVLFSLTANVGIGNAIETARFGVGAMGDFIGLPIILRQGTQCFVQCQTQQQSVQVVFCWRERRIGTWEDG